MSDEKAGAERELTVDELDVEDMVSNMHLRVAGGWTLLGRDVAAFRPAHLAKLRDDLWTLIPFLKALGRLALAHPEETRRLWAEALREPMPFGSAPVGMTRAPVEPKP